VTANAFRWPILSTLTQALFTPLALFGDLCCNGNIDML